ncbi:GNAT family N-acetyltransferase [Psychromonas sp. psych-6C06]|uniref:lysophospholipid acyltransferase family protein n=1 Tax=Psychromonas sp. psych-6C06 TaxID=2058089 RepID=UPI000C33E472|nr:lysophospholipid acyltransferase family protein [Psychromonas sp. psych-6C06]PKF62992.1 GNAT family N-acetyltransferase [Psychromonas sp. psych-6C06]
MISTEQFLLKQFPALPIASKRHKLLKFVFKRLLHEKEFIDFAQRYPLLSGFDFVEKALEYFEFKIATTDSEIEHIPVTGRVVIIANHPIGSLDAFALLHTIRKLRPDVKVVANELLMSVPPLQDILLPVNNLTGNTLKRDLKNIHQFLDDEGALIIFPAGEVSRVTPQGIRDRAWEKGFLTFAERAKAPILPIHIQARNSLTFYATSLFYKPLASLLLVKEMFKHNHTCIKLSIGKSIPYTSYGDSKIANTLKIKLLQKQLYRVAKRKESLFKTESAIAHPVNRVELKKSIEHCEQLGTTNDGKQIYLYQSEQPSIILKELGRLREFTFRSVGEGTGNKRDLDPFDHQYMHLILWDPEDLEIVGAYRFSPIQRLMKGSDSSGLYTDKLFNYQDEMLPYFEKGIELGRSFVQPRYWGKRSLDYLWQGIGAFLAQNPQYRYLLGPVTLSAALPQRAQAFLVYFYQLYFPAQGDLAYGRDSYQLSEELEDELWRFFSADDYAKDFAKLKTMLANMGVSVPTLYKQYTELCEHGGVQFVDFNIDPDFSNCIDGLVIVDVKYLKAKKRARYIDVHQRTLEKE